MRVGLTVSIIGHAALLGFGFFALPKAEPFKTEAIDALPVDLVTIADVTDLALGDKKSDKPPEDTPQPKPEVQAEAPAPPQEKPADKPVEAANQAAAPPPPEPQPEPKPEPRPEPQQVAALPPPAEPAPPQPAPAPEPAPVPEPAPQATPEPQPPATSRLPRARPAPPKPVAEQKPQPKRPPLPQVKPGEEFNPDDIAALLNKQDPRGGGDPIPAPGPTTVGTVHGRNEAAMTQTWLAALRSKLAQCWSPPVGVREAQTLVVSVTFNLNPDGSLAAPPELTRVTGSNPLAQVAAETAVRAIAQCAPYNDIFPAEHYDIWGQAITVDFDPREMFGAG
jgi:outer membrane biosynthesis protein TonB